MEPATADPSLLTSTATSGTGGTVIGGPVVGGSVAVQSGSKGLDRALNNDLLITSRVRESLTRGDV